MSLAIRILLFPCLAVLILFPGFRSYAETPAQQSNQAQWDRLSEAQKTKLRQEFQRWQAMPKQSQDRLLGAYRKFKSLPPAQQNRVLGVFHWYKSLPADRQTVLKTRIRQVMSLPPAQRSQFWKNLRLRHEGKGLLPKRNGAPRPHRFR